MAIKLITYGHKKKTKSLGLGVFDGIHKGHQAILSQCDALLTFNPHPVTILHNTITLDRLTTVKEMTLNNLKNLIEIGRASCRERV